MLRTEHKGNLVVPKVSHASGEIVERFVQNENLRRFRRLLEEERDEEKRNMIRKLLAEEEAKDIPASLKDRPDKSKHGPT